MPDVPGHLIDDRHVEISVEGHRQGPRDRCGSHYQKVGLHQIGLLFELHTLRNAKPVLFVDHDNTKTVEVDALLYEGVGAYHEIDLTRRDVLEQPGLGDVGPVVGGGDRAGEEGKMDCRLPAVKQAVHAHLGPGPLETR